MHYTSGMVDEQEFKKKFSDLNKEQMLDMMYHQEVEIQQMKENMSSMKRRLFGHTSEHISPDQLAFNLFNEAEVTEEEATPEEKAEAETITYTRKKTRNSKIKDLPVEEEHIYTTDNTCPICGSKMEEMKPRTIEYLVHIPERYYIRRIVIHQNTCKKCNDKNLNCTICTGDTSKVPARLLSSSFVTASVVATIAYNKFLVGIPFYRQSKDLAAKGVDLSRQVLCDWMMRCGDEYLRLVFQKMKNDLRQSSIVNMDETELEVLEEKRSGRESASYIWLAMTNQYVLLQSDKRTRYGY